MKKKHEVTARQKRIAELETKLGNGMSEAELIEYEKLVRLEATVADSNTKNKDTKSTGRVRRITGWIGAATGVIGSLGSIALFNTYVDKGFEFEKEGTYTSSTFKEIIRRINLPKFGGK